MIQKLTVVSIVSSPIVHFEAIKNLVIVINTEEKNLDNF